MLIIRSANKSFHLEEDGYQFWFNIKHDLDMIHLHRDNDLPAIVYKEGTQGWYRDNDHHRDGDLPAFISAYVKAYFRHGNLHRENGPAYIIIDGESEWYIDGIKVDSQSLLPIE